MYKGYIKRQLDIVISFFLIVLFFLPSVLIAIAVNVKLGTPIIFKQKRPGYKGKIFTLYKFRTMTDERDENGELLPDEKRLTKFGLFLRKTSLDELPELWNVLKGDMSLVGPRPLLVSYLPYYTKRESLRHTVKPGITGLAQVNGRNFIDWDHRLELDARYVEHIGFVLDLWILIKTVAVVLGSHDEVAEVTDDVEGNLAEIREAKRAHKGKR